MDWSVLEACVTSNIIMVQTVRLSTSSYIVMGVSYSWNKQVRYSLLLFVYGDVFQSQEVQHKVWYIGMKLTNSWASCV